MFCYFHFYRYVYFLGNLDTSSVVTLLIHACWTFQHLNEKRNCLFDDIYESQYLYCIFLPQRNITSYLLRQRQWSTENISTNMYNNYGIIQKEHICLHTFFNILCLMLTSFVRFVHQTSYNLSTNGKHIAYTTHDIRTPAIIIKYKGDLMSCSCYQEND